MVKINKIYKERFIKKNFKVNDSRYYFLFRNKSYRKKLPFHYRIDKGNHYFGYCLYRKQGSLIETYFPLKLGIENIKKNII